ncbi:hypothetical protein, partial [Burkholderia cepacia]|uniref:hypothetical protein n=1 Tax=Burkholderia cepacia TaxID=292 RepID=UPI0026DF819B
KATFSFNRHRLLLPPSRRTPLSTITPEDIVSAKMVRRTRIQGATALAFFTAIIFAALFQLGSHG